jgi:hypothetical protein
MISTTTAIWRRQQIATQFTGGIAIAFLAIAAVFIAPTALQAQVSGAVFTTDSTCSGVDLNIYGSKDDVYIDGGPAHPGAAGLPDGSYCVQVTDPSTGTVLGQSAAGAVTVLGGEFEQCYQLSTILNTATSGFTTPGYDDTPNPGGEYKVSISTDCTFTNSNTKTDNFKVVANTPPPPPDHGKLCVDKFYDANANGVKDGNESFIDNWLVFISGGTLQDSFLTDVCLTLSTGSYTVSEAHSVIGNWLQTAALLDGAPPVPPLTLADPVSVTINANDNHEVLFGNVCLGGGGGLTLGFWSNKNGQKLETAADFTFLNSLCLVAGVNGGHQVFSTTLSTAKGQLNTWLLNATATNMAYMLSAQLATMELNVRHGFVDPNALVHTGGCGNTGFDGSFITVGDLMAAANDSLCAHPVTKTAGPDRTYQECLKNALDDANNNKNFTQSTPCDFSFGN